ncbi:MAG: hypothetical protein CMI36_07850 [Owenweeksia sp.]|nr:hypothetical protein [Owenweeksia sp.]
MKNRLPFLLICFCLFISSLYAQDECPLEPVEKGPSVTEITTHKASFTPLSYGTSSKTATTGDKVIFWLHGLAGNAKSWGPVAARTASGGAPGYPARKVVYSNPEVVSYDDTYGNLNDAALQVSGGINSQDPLSLNLGLPFDENIIIAHSQGGLVARSLDRLYDTDPATHGPRKFGGLVTFGTPHQGAAILKNIRSGPGYPDMLTQFVQSGCPEVIWGALMEDFYDGVLGFTNLDALLANTLNTVCDLTAQNIIPMAIHGFTGPITYDYQPGGPGLTNLQAFSHNNLDIVAFYGVEDEPVFWRTTASFTQSGNDSAANVDPFFLTLNHDQQAVDDAETERDFQLMKKNYWEGLESFHHSKYKQSMFFARLAPGLSPAFLAKARNHYNKYYESKDIKNAYNNGYLWYLNANMYWKEIIGARESVYQSVGTTCECDYFDGSLPQSAAYGSNSTFTHVNTGGGSCDYNVSSVTLVKSCQTDPFNPNQCQCDYYESYDGTNPSGNPVFTATESGGDCTGAGGGFEPVNFWRRCTPGNQMGWTIVEHGNDGVVVQESAGGLTQALINYELSGANNQEMRNSPLTKDVLNNLFDGDLSLDPNINLAIFKIDPR